MSLIETMIALSIAMVMFAALGVVSLAGVRSVVLSRQNQQAADVLNRAVERARSMPFQNLTMITSDLASDSAISGSPAKYTVPGGIGAEPVDAKAVGAVSPHKSTESPDGKVQFSLRRYVTLPASATLDISGIPSVRRFTAVVSWQAYGDVHTRVVSTLITDTRRGLPLPNYLLQAIAPTVQTKQPGNPVSFTFTVRNLGARDTFNITASSGTWSFYADTNGNGTLDVDEDPSTTDADLALGNWDATAGNSDPDTGPLEPNQTKRFFARRTITEGDGASVTTTFTTVSAAQPLEAAGTKTAAVVYHVQSGSVSTPPPSGGPSCPTTTGGTATGGTTLTSFFLRNRPVGSTATTTHNPLSREDCTVQSADHDFSTEDPGHSVGRVIRPGGTSGNVASNLAAEFRYQVSAATLVQGTAVLKFPFRCTSATGPVTVGTATFQVMVGTRNNDNANLSGFSAISSFASPSYVCPATGWSVVSMPVAVSMTVAKDKWLAVRLVTSATSSRVLVNYDSPTAVSMISIPVAP
jgi:hypothetical protein